jgi:hypothetical protein
LTVDGYIRFLICEFNPYLDRTFFFSEFFLTLHSGFSDLYFVPAILFRKLFLTFLKTLNMRKTFFMWLFIALAFFANGQGKTLYRVTTLTPKAGMTSAFEDSWKSHVVKFHNGSDKREVYEVVSGPEDGSYVIVQGPVSYASMDTTLPNAKEHGLDMEKTFSSLIEPARDNVLVRWVDTLSYKSDVLAQLFLLSITVVKDGQMADYMAELRKAVLLYTKLNSPFSFNTMVKQQAGSSPTIISIRNLKAGYKELDADYYHLASDWFKTAYVKEYGQADWDKRVKLMTDDVVSRTQHFEKLRPDLSSK